MQAVAELPAHAQTPLEHLLAEMHTSNKPRMVGMGYGLTKAIHPDDLDVSRLWLHVLQYTTSGPCQHAADMRPLDLLTSCFTQLQEEALHDVSDHMAGLAQLM
jgi:hypothetical protein